MIYKKKKTDETFKILRCIFKMKKLINWPMEPGRDVHVAWRSTAVIASSSIQKRLTVAWEFYTSYVVLCNTCVSWRYLCYGLWNSGIFTSLKMFCFLDHNRRKSRRSSANWMCIARYGSCDTYFTIVLWRMSREENRQCQW